MAKFRYAPMLRTKAGEGTALTNLQATAKARILPVFHVVHNPPASFGTVIAAAWAGLPIAVDGTFSFDVTGNGTAYTQLFDHIGKGKVGVFPSVEFGADPAYVTIIQKVRGRYAPGVMVKAKPNQLASVEKWVVSNGWKTNEVDLVVILTEIAGYDPEMLEPVVTKYILDNIPNPSPWRSLTLSSSAAPKDMSGLVAGRNLVPRLEWRVWKGVSASVPYQLDYADFVSVHPDLTDPPGYVMAKATVSVRYTIDDYWIIYKGTPTSGKTGKPMPTQYRAHAKALVADPAFGGLVGCWGDNRIQQIAGGSPGAGGRPLWASISASRHISLVADRLP